MVLGGVGFPQRGSRVERGYSIHPSRKRLQHPSKLEMLVVWTRVNKAETMRGSRSSEMDGRGEAVSKTGTSDDPDS